MSLQRCSALWPRDPVASAVRAADEWLRAWHLRPAYRAVPPSEIDRIVLGRRFHPSRLTLAHRETTLAEWGLPIPYEDDDPPSLIVTKETGDAAVRAWLVSVVPPASVRAARTAWEKRRERARLQRESAASDARLRAQLAEIGIDWP